MNVIPTGILHSTVPGQGHMIPILLPRNVYPTYFSKSSKPTTSLGHRGEGKEFSERGPNFLNYVQWFLNMSNKYSRESRKFSWRLLHPAPP